MTLTLAERFALQVKSNAEKVTAQAHAAIAKGKVVEIALATGITAAPADNDRLGLFGVALEAVDSGDEGVFQIRGVCQAMTGDTSAIGTFMNPMQDMMLNTCSTQTDGNHFAKLLETGEDGVLKTVMITNQ